jgi:glycosyltransferase involved in cell wall biosynthesis
MKRVTSRLLVRSSVDVHPWSHPFLTAEKIARFRAFSEQVWSVAAEQRRRSSKPLNAAFAVNMAQNMYKWAVLAAGQGVNATLYLHPQDRSAISRPEWEEFDGEFPDLFDGAGFLAAHPELTVKVPCVDPPNDGAELMSAFSGGAQSEAAMKLKKRTPGVRHSELLDLQGMYPYFAWAEMLSRHDVIYAASSPFSAYASGKPYCTFSVGGDLQYDCGRNDTLGSAMRAAFASARFILASNPHTLGHCRRLGFDNALYLPYPMDTDRYCPGEGTARAGWVSRFGGEVFVLATARIDGAIKGHTAELQDRLFKVAQERAEVRFVFLGWGTDAERLRTRAAASGVSERILVLPPVGKARLLDYYRSADIVLDHFVYGYLAATALEAAAVGKPVVMNLRGEQYAPLYRGDVAPVQQADSPELVRLALLALIDSREQRLASGRLMREWVLRNHGQQLTAPRLVDLLQFAADGANLPGGLDNPLDDELSAEELAYHEACRQP